MYIETMLKVNEDGQIELYYRAYYNLDNKPKYELTDTLSRKESRKFAEIILEQQKIT